MSDLFKSTETRPSRRAATADGAIRAQVHRITNVGPGVAHGGIPGCSDAIRPAIKTSYNAQFPLPPITALSSAIAPLTEMS